MFDSTQQSSNLDATLQSTERATTKALEPGGRIGRYLLIETLGQGAMGTVWAAFDPQLDRRVAIKLLRAAGGSETAAESLLREAQTMAQLAHPNVLAVFDAGREGSEVFVVMEVAAGGTLAEWLASSRRRRAQLLGRRAREPRRTHAQSALRSFTSEIGSDRFAEKDIEAWLAAHPTRKWCAADGPRDQLQPRHRLPEVR